MISFHQRSQKHSQWPLFIKQDISQIACLSLLNLWINISRNDAFMISVLMQMIESHFYKLMIKKKKKKLACA